MAAPGSETANSPTEKRVAGPVDGKVRAERQLLDRGDDCSAEPLGRQYAEESRRDRTSGPQDRPIVSVSPSAIFPVTVMSRSVPSQGRSMRRVPPAVPAGNRTRDRSRPWTRRIPSPSNASASSTGESMTATVPANSGSPVRPCGGHMPACGDAANGGHCLGNVRRPCRGVHAHRRCDWR